jgi:hypothetical protein
MDFGKLLLDCLQPFMPLAVSDLGLRLIRPLKPIFLIQLVNVSDLSTQTRDLFPKHFQMIHMIRIPHSCVPARLQNRLLRGHPVNLFLNCSLIRESAPLQNRLAVLNHLRMPA